MNEVLKQIKKKEMKNLLAFIALVFVNKKAKDAFVITFEFWLKMYWLVDPSVG